MTTPGENPLNLLYSSKNHAITLESGIAKIQNYLRHNSSRFASLLEITVYLQGRRNSKYQAAAIC